MPTGRHQLVIAYAGLGLALGTAIYSAGALGQRVDNNADRIERLESQQPAFIEIRERLARIETILIEREVRK